MDTPNLSYIGPSSATAAASKAPTDDAITSTLQHRFNNEWPYTSIGESILVSVNPHQPLDNLDDASAFAYTQDDLKQQPHPYEFAARLQHALQSSRQSQAVVYRCVTFIAKSTAG